jgi:8-oxo-dGTP diphosphatase
MILLVLEKLLIADCYILHYSMRKFKITEKRYNIMLSVDFYNGIEDSLLKFAVIVSKSQGKWVLCKHRERDTYECPGGHREDGEDIFTTAKRELYEETGATDYVIKQICIYSVCCCDGVIENKIETFGMLYYADINKFEKLPGFEIEKIELFEKLPDNWTYPEIQPKLIEKVNNTIASSAEHNCMQT